ncbi:MAG: ribbon-helix-helix protein, CopG family [Candidatus Nezhaarchaeota archaeon]|nr:ribbon-helix-helix protein, CopG family [Candidatus Nezhaarchaeota archaeon]
MSRYVTVSAKVPRELREKAAKFGINVNQLIRRALEEEVRRREREHLKGMAQEVSLILSKVPAEDIVRIVREDRVRG